MRARAFTLIELLVVLAILGILFAMTVFAWRDALRRQEDAATLHKLSGLFWVSATRAASEGRRLVLCKEGNVLRVRVSSPSPCNGKVRSEIALPDGFEVGLPEGKLLTFEPPGKLAFEGTFTNPFDLVTPQGRYQYRVSVIGEVKVIRP